MKSIFAHIYSCLLQVKHNAEVPGTGLIAYFSFFNIADTAARVLLSICVMLLGLIVKNWAQTKWPDIFGKK
jgi:hypothetical protein